MKKDQALCYKGTVNNVLNQNPHPICNHQMAVLPGEQAEPDQIQMYQQVTEAAAANYCCCK